MTLDHCAVWLSVMKPAWPGKLCQLFHNSMISRISCSKIIAHIQIECASWQQGLLLTFLHSICHWQCFFFSPTDIIDKSELKAFFEGNCSQIYFIFYENFITLESNLKQKGEHNYSSFTGVSPMAIAHSIWVGANIFFYRLTPLPIFSNELVAKNLVTYWTKVPTEVPVFVTLFTFHLASFGFTLPWHSLACRWTSFLWNRVN